MCGNVVSVFFGASCVVGGCFRVGLEAKNTCQVAYLTEGLVRFDSAGLETARGPSPHTLEHNWQAADRVESKERIYVNWRGVVSV